MSKAAMVALYARVSSEQQNKRGTIESQIAALKERIAADGAQIVDDMCFVDAGVSGATLIRPQLERLRDCAALSAIDQLYILSPDRLARKYAHQALLMEEFTACGIQVVFLNHAIGTTPEESLLLQMQGMIAEYERAKIAERHRRGKLHGAKRGSVNVLSGAPYGYRYIRRQLDGTPARYVIELPQAATVRAIFQWVGMDRLSIGEVVRRLTESGTVTASGKPYWDRSVVWGILRNPCIHGASCVRQDAVARSPAGARACPAPQCRRAQKAVLNNTHRPAGLDRDSGAGHHQRGAVPVDSGTACREPQAGTSEARECAVTPAARVDGLRPVPLRLLRKEGEQGCG
jgi:DNA invertase Pin-like site-specific DNA recombinase